MLRHIKHGIAEQRAAEESESRDSGHDDMGPLARRSKPSSSAANRNNCKPRAGVACVDEQRLYHVVECTQHSSIEAPMASSNMPRRPSGVLLQWPPAWHDSLCRSVAGGASATEKTSARTPEINSCQVTDPTPRASQGRHGVGAPIS